MPHALICGTSECGKTTLAKTLALEWRRRGTGVIVFDPWVDRWPANVQFSNPHKFLAYVKEARGCAIFADEAGDQIGRNNREFDWLATNARHRGHEVHFLSQFPTQLHPKIRCNCSWLYAFRSDENAADTLARDFTRKELREILPELGQFEFVAMRKFAPGYNICRLNLVNGQQVIKTIEGPGGKTLDAK